MPEWIDRFIRSESSCCLSEPFVSHRMTSLEGSKDAKKYGHVNFQQKISISRNTNRWELPSKVEELNYWIQIQLKNSK